MSWETTDILSGGNIISKKIETQDKQFIFEQNELKRLTQLKKLQDSQGNEKRQTYKTTMSQFSDLLVQNNKERIIESLLTDDCEVFLFNFAETVPVQYAFEHKGFTKLMSDKRVIRREVKETHVSLKKSTGFQICDCEVIDESKGVNMYQFSFETFSFKENKISKYRASYGTMPATFGPESLFIPTKQERMLAKVRELNYAWADQPDLERIASMLPEDSDYKIYRWKDRKCFTFDKHNLASEFRKRLEEDFVIKSIVPFDVSCEAQYILGSYVFYLDGKNNLSDKSFIWVSTCIFSFDQNCNIKKMSQQGELYSEDEKLIPFQVYSQEHRRDKLIEYVSIPLEENVSMLGADEFLWTFQINSFGSPDCLFKGQIKGFSQCDILNKMLFSKDRTLGKTKLVDIFEDLDDPFYDSIIAIECNKGIINKENYQYCGKEINFYSIGKISFENGKVAKTIGFSCLIPDPIPSPFDDDSFTDLNIKPKSEFI